MNELELLALSMSGPLGAKAADHIKRLEAALKEGIHYADVVSLDDGMPEGKQATRLTATWMGADIHYAAEWNVKAARRLITAGAR